MREAKKNISAEYLERLNASPYFIVVEYQGLKVDQFADLRQRLDGAQAELHVVKNRIFNIAAQQAGIEGDLASDLKGQMAVITGEAEISAAKIIKNFESEFDKPSIKFGYMGNTADANEVKVGRSSRSAQGQNLGVLWRCQKLAVLLNTPAVQLAQVIKAGRKRRDPTQTNFRSTRRLEWAEAYNTNPKPVGLQAAVLNRPGRDGDTQSIWQT